MDLYIAQLISHFGQGTRVDALSYLISRWPFLGLCLLIIWVLSYWKSPTQRKQYLISFAVGVVLFYLINELTFKHILVNFIWTRTRPYIAHPDIIRAIWSQIFDSSFPSSHVASTVLILTLWVWRSSKMRVIAFVFALLVALSRVHNGMHYPTDVLAGVVLGLVYGYLWIHASKHIVRKAPNLQ